MPLAKSDAFAVATTLAHSQLATSFVVESQNNHDHPKHVRPRRHLCNTRSLPVLSPSHRFRSRRQRRRRFSCKNQLSSLSSVLTLSRVRAPLSPRNVLGFLVTATRFLRDETDERTCDSESRSVDLTGSRTYNRRSVGRTEVRFLPATPTDAPSVGLQTRFTLDLILAPSATASSDRRIEQRTFRLANTFSCTLNVPTLPTPVICASPSLTSVRGKQRKLTLRTVRTIRTPGQVASKQARRALSTEMKTLQHLPSAHRLPLILHTVPSRPPSSHDLKPPSQLLALARSSPHNTTLSRSLTRRTCLEEITKVSELGNRSKCYKVGLKARGAASKARTYDDCER